MTDFLSVAVRMQPHAADTDVIDAFRKGGELRSIGSSSYRFDWFPILAGFDGQPEAMPGSEFSSTIARQQDIWRWTFDPYPLIVGPILWRTANALRVLALLGYLRRQTFCIGWYAAFQGVVIAADEASRDTNQLLITSAFAELVGGSVGEAVYAALQAQFGGAIHREDHLTSESERRSSLIASFIEDQLAVRPAISQAEIDELKRRLDLS